MFHFWNDSFGSDFHPLTIRDLHLMDNLSGDVGGGG